MEPEQIAISKNDFLDYKDILLFDKTITNTTVLVIVPFSRFKIILSNYMVLESITINDDLASRYDDYTISRINNRNNVYKIVKSCTKEEEKEDGVSCLCPEKRLIGVDKEKCYYCMRLEKNYATKITDSEPQTKKNARSK
jgi:hypothetical protein